MKIGFIVNPKAGVKKSAYDEIHEWAGKHLAGKHEIAVEATGHRGHATEIARDFAGKNFDVVAAAGGDGTANETAKGLIGSETALTIIPYGSGNGLARGLGIPLNRERAVRAIPGGRTQLIDAGQVNDGLTEKLFFGFSGTGYDAYIGKLFNERNGRRGFLPYVYLSVAGYRAFQPIPVTLTINGSTIEATPFILAIANTNEYGNGAIIAPHAVPDDGWLEVCLIQNITFMKGVLQGWRLFHGSIDRIKETTTWRVKELTITPKEKIFYHLDGEAAETDRPLKFSILTQRLKIWVP